MIVISENNIGDLWLNAMRALMVQGNEVAPRGHGCREICDVKLVLFEAQNNFLVHPVRKLSPRFAVAEWLWIWFGRQDVKTISRYSPKIAQFSDDGISFNGTYGIPIVAQWEHTLNLLKDDPDTRQAVISIFRFTDVDTLVATGKLVRQQWRSKDIPCTLTLQFLLRDGRLNMIASMRSSDVWLGLPYDTFNFSMMLNIMSGQLSVPIGQLSLNLGSSHLYDSNLEAAKEVQKSSGDVQCVRAPALPGAPPAWLEEVLTGNERAGVGEQWSLWERYAAVLAAKTDKEALACLVV